MKGLTILAPLLVLAAAAAVYGGSGGHGRLPEDELAVWSNPAVTGSALRPALLGRFYDHRGDGFRPAVRPAATLALRLESGVFRQDRSGFQWVQVALLAVAGILFFFLLRRELRSGAAALAGSLLLVVHPLATAAVLPLAGVSVLLALDLLLGLLLLVGALLERDPEPGDVASAIVVIGLLALMALWSDEWAYAGVAATLGWIWRAHAKPRDGRGGQLPVPGGTRAPATTLGWTLGAVLAGGIAVALAHRVLSIALLPENFRIGRAVLPDTGLGWARRALLGLASLPSAARLLVFPHPLGYVHDVHPHGGWVWPAGLAGLAILAALGWLGFQRVRGRSLALWAGLILFSLIGVAGIAGPTGDFVSERLLFPALLGVIGLLLAGLLWLGRGLSGAKWRAGALVAGGVIILLFGHASLRRSGAFVDWETLVQTETKAIPESPQGWYDLGNIYLARRQWDGAASEYQTALRLRPDFWMAWVNLGAAYFGEQEPGLAMRAFEHALQGTKGRPAFVTVEARADYNRALILMQQDRNVEAARAFTRMLTVFPDHAPSHANLGFIYSNDPKLDNQALLHLHRALELETDPNRQAILEDFIRRIHKRRENLENKVAVPADSVSNPPDLPPDEGSAEEPGEDLAPAEPK